MDRGFVITTDWEDVFDRQLDSVEKLICLLNPDKIIVIRDDSRHSHHMAMLLDLRIQKTSLQRKIKKTVSVLLITMPCFNKVAIKDGIVDSRDFNRVKKGLDKIKPPNGDLVIIFCPFKTAKVIWNLSQGLAGADKLYTRELRAPSNVANQPMLVNFFD